jgi:hypothetical protein
MVAEALREVVIPADVHNILDDCGTGVAEVHCPMQSSCRPRHWDRVITAVRETHSRIRDDR